MSLTPPGVSTTSILNYVVIDNLNDPMVGMKIRWPIWKWHLWNFRCDWDRGALPCEAFYARSKIKIRSHALFPLHLYKKTNIPVSAYGHITRIISRRPCNLWFAQRSEEIWSFRCVIKTKASSLEINEEKMSMLQSPLYELHEQLQNASNSVTRTASGTSVVYGSFGLHLNVWCSPRWGPGRPCY